MNKTELKQKLLQLFICGYSQEYPDKKFFDLVSSNLGGVIFFAENLKNRQNFKNLITELKSISTTPLFLSIDQEGGLVERTIFLDEKVEYLTPKALSRLNNKNDFKKHYDILAKDLIDLGINLNFAPVLDVNSNAKNPIIGVRSFGNNSSIVSSCAKEVISAFKENNIISCGKHFAGHGDTEIDSHINMPCVNMDFHEFNSNHLAPFVTAIKDGIDTIMVSHVHFPFFDEEKIPASLSENVIENYLKKVLGFKGLIFSDDMVMGGVAKHYGIKESIIKALNAGIDVFIYRNISDELLSTLDEITDLAMKDTSLQNKILTAYEKVIQFKKEKLTESKTKGFNTKIAQEIIDKIALNTVNIEKDSELNKNLKDKNVKIIAFNRKDIFNLSYSENNLDKLIQANSIEEINYPINPTQDDIKKIKNEINNDDIIIFLSYNAHINNGQVDLFNSINNKKILVSCALDDDITLFANAESIISLACAKYSSLKALANIFNE